MRPFALDRMDLKNIMKNSPTRLVSILQEFTHCALVNFLKLIMSVFFFNYYF